MKLYTDKYMKVQREILRCLEMASKYEKDSDHYNKWMQRAGVARIEKEKLRNEGCHRAS